MEKELTDFQKKLLAIMPTDDERIGLALMFQDGNLSDITIENTVATVDCIIDKILQRAGIKTEFFDALPEHKIVYPICDVCHKPMMVPGGWACKDCHTYKSV